MARQLMRVLIVATFLATPAGCRAADDSANGQSPSSGRPSQMLEESVTNDRCRHAAAAPASTDDPSTDDSALPPGWRDAWPCFRGPEMDGVCRLPDIPLDWDESTGRGIVWKAHVPLGGLSSPVVWGGRVFVSGADLERHEVYCFDAETGEKLWTGSYESDPEAPTQYAYWPDLEEVIHAAPTPVVDGRRVYANFANGEVACFDIDTGRCLWHRWLGDIEGNTYGWSSSLLRFADHLIVQFDGAESFLIALNAETGETIWKTERDGLSWSSPILTKGGRDDWTVVISEDPSTAAYDPADGRRIWWADLLYGDVAPTPLPLDGSVVVCNDAAGMHRVRCGGEGDLTDQAVVWSLTELPKGGFPTASSPVCDGRLLYIFQDRRLTCISVEDGSVVYSEELPEPASYASPTMACGKLLVFAGSTTYVVEPGPEFELVRTCHLDAPMSASPAFAPGRMFLRTDHALYCIGPSNAE